MNKFNIILSLILTLAHIGFSETNRVCSDAPQAITPFNSDWYYSEFTVPESYKVTSLYGGFTRPGYIPAHYDYIAQFYTPGQMISSLGDYQLFNYDLIDDPLYNREFNIEDLNVVGMGTLRMAVPITHGVIWHEACVTMEKMEPVESVPEPSTLAFFILGIAALVFATRLKMIRSK